MILALLLSIPLAYDHVPTALVEIRKVNIAHLRRVCMADNSMGCAFPRRDRCIIYVPNNPAKYPVGYIIRHEIAHCNGWPADHPK